MRFDESDYDAFRETQAQWDDVAAGERFDRESDEMDAANPQWFGDHDVIPCREEGQHRLSARHAARECPVELEAEVSA